MKIQKVSELVKEILQNNKSTRDNDNLLYIEVVYKLKPEVVNSNFKYVFENANLLKLPSFKSVERSRRKLQAMYKELKASEEVEQARTEKIEEYIDYSREKESATAVTVTQESI